MFYAAFVSSPDGGRKTFELAFYRQLAAESAKSCARRDWRPDVKEHSQHTPASGQRVRSGNEEPRPLSNGMLVIFFAALAAALVLGYLLLNKLGDTHARKTACYRAAGNARPPNCR
jgi:hypothetical protein